MIRQGTPYPARLEPDDNLSDLDLYEEARSADKEAFVIVPRVKKDDKVVITFQGSELVRGGGGPRCMTCPVQRDDPWS